MPGVVSAYHVGPQNSTQVSRTVGSTSPAESCHQPHVNRFLIGFVLSARLTGHCAAVQADGVTGMHDYAQLSWGQSRGFVHAVQALHGM